MFDIIPGMTSKMRIILAVIWVFLGVFLILVLVREGRGGERSGFDPGTFFLNVGLESRSGKTAGSPISE